jgi:quinol monooxygenase YgiN
VRKESGCLHADFYQDVENEKDFLVVEEWATQKDWDDHLQSDIFTVLMGAGTLMRRPPEIVIHTVSGSTELET